MCSRSDRWGPDQPSRLDRLRRCSPHTARPQPATHVRLAGSPHGQAPRTTRVPAWAAAPSGRSDAVGAPAPVPRPWRASAWAAASAARPKTARRRRWGGSGGGAGSARGAGTVRRAGGGAGRAGAISVRRRPGRATAFAGAISVGRRAGRATAFAGAISVGRRAGDSRRARAGEPLAACDSGGGAEPRGPGFRRLDGCGSGVLTREAMSSDLRVSVGHHRTGSIQDGTNRHTGSRRHLFLPRQPPPVTRCLSALDRLLGRFLRRSAPPPGDRPIPAARRTLRGDGGLGAAPALHHAPQAPRTL